MEQIPREKKLTLDRHDGYGNEIVDSVPMQPPLGYKRAPSLAEQIRQQVVAHKLEMLEQMEETDEEADDFEVGDDFEPSSKYENDGAPTIKELKAKAAEINERIKKAHLAKLRETLRAEHAEKQESNQALPLTTPAAKPPA